MNVLRNKVQLIGRVGKTPEVKKFESGKITAQFSMATPEVYYDDKNNKVELTHWHNLVAWGKMAERIENFVQKGQEIAIEGKLTYREYETKEGVKKNITEVIISELIMFGSSKPIDKI